jgi:hypothetical protein
LATTRADERSAFRLFDHDDHEIGLFALHSLTPNRQELDGSREWMMRLYPERRDGYARDAA